MYASSTYTENKTVRDIRYITRMLVLIAITINFGYKSQFYIEQKTLLGSIQFIGSLFLLYRAASLKSSHYNSDKNVFYYENHGDCVKPFMLIITITKMVTEICFAKFYDNNFVKKSSNRFLRIFILDLMNARIYDPTFDEKIHLRIKERGLGLIILTNFLDFACIYLLIYIDKKYKGRVNFSHLAPMKDILDLALIPLKILIFVFLLLEINGLKLNIFSLIYLLLLYFLMRIQIGTITNSQKGGNEKYLVITKWIIFSCFILREIAIFLRRKNTLNLDKKPIMNSSDLGFTEIILYRLLDSSLEGRFFRRFLVYFCCQYYSYFKSIKHRVRLIETEIKTQKLPRDPEYKKSYFRNLFLQYMPKIMKKTIFYHEEKNTKMRIRLLEKYFIKHKWISKFKIALGIKKNKEKMKDEKYARKKIVKNTFKKIGVSILSLLIENISFAFRIILLLTTMQICVNSREIEFYMFSFKAYDLSLLIWCLFSFILPIQFSSEVFLIKFSLNIMYPFFLVGLFLRRSAILTRKFQGKTINLEKMNQIKKIRLFSFFLLICYILIQIGKKSAKALNTKFGRWYYKKKKKLKLSKSSLVDTILEELIRAVIRFSRLITLISAIYASLMSIQIFNTFLLVITLWFFWTARHDQKYWEMYLYYNVLILVLIFISQILPINIPHFNQELMTMLGVARAKPEHYERQFRLFFITTFFCSVYNKYKDKILLPSELSLGHWKKAKKFMKSLTFLLKKIHTDFTIWIYHIALFTLLSMEKNPDILSAFLFFIDVVIFAIHLNLTFGKIKKKRINRKRIIIRRVWYPSFFFVLTLIFLRYLSFYVRFQTLRNPLNSISPQNDLRKNFLFRLIFRDLESRKLNNLSREFIIEVLLLGISFMTLTGLKKEREEYLYGNAKKEKALKKLKKKSKQRGTKIDGITKEKLKELEKEIEQEEEMEKKALEELEMKSSSSSSFSSDDSLENIPVDLDYSKDVENLDEYFEEIEIKEKKDEFVNSDKLFKGWNLINFVCLFILFRSVVFILVVTILAVKLDTQILDILFVGADLLFFNVLFWNFSSVFKLFNIENFIAKQMSYFERGFVKLMNEHNSFPTIHGKSKIDLNLKNLGHNRHYIKQLMKKLEVEIVNTSTSVSVLKLAIMIMNTFKMFFYKIYENPEELQKLKKEHGDRVKEVYQEEATRECLGRILIIALMIIEFVFMNGYLNSKGILEEQDPKSLAHFLALLKKKLDYLNFFTKTKLKHLSYYLKNKRTKRWKNRMKKNKKLKRREGEEETTVRVLKMNQENIWRREKKDDLNYIVIKRRAYFNALKTYERESENNKHEKLNPEDFYFDKIENCSLDFIKSKNKTNGQGFKIRVIMDEGASKMKKFLFIHRNRHKLNFCTFIRGFKASARRLILIPLLYSSFTLQNPINIFILIPCWIYSFKTTNSIETDIKIFLPIFSFIFTIFFSYELLRKSESNLSKPLDMMLRIRDENTKESKNALPFFSGFILVIALYYIASIFLVYFISFRLFVIRKKFKTLYFYFREEMGIKKIFLNFKAWQKSGLAIFTQLIESVFQNAGNYYLILVFVLSILQTTKMNLIFLIGVIVLTFFELIKRFQKYTLKSLGPQRLKRICRLITIVIYVLNFKYNLVVVLFVLKRLFPKIIEGIKDYITIKEGMIAFGIASLLTFLLTDLMTSSLYIKEAKKIRERNELKSKVVGLYRAYVENEKKVYARVKLMCKMSRLNDIEEMIWANMDDLKKLKFDYKYWHRELESSIEGSMNKLLTGYIKKGKLMRINFKKRIMEFLIRNTTLTLFEDTLCVLLKVIAKNSHLLKGEVLDIEDFYAGKMDLYKYYLMLIQDYYEKLRRRNGKETKEFMKRFLITTYQTKAEDDEDDDELMGDDMSSLSVIRSDSADSGLGQFKTGKRMSIFLEKNLGGINDTKSNKVTNKLKNKDKKHLRKATNFLFNELNIQREKDELFLTKELENMDTFECKYGKRKIVFFNLETNFLKRTKGFMKVSMNMILSSLFRFGISNFELILSFFLILNQVFFGAFENVITLGILFFFILIEVHRGQTFWWRILFVSFLIKCFCKYSSRIYIEGQDERSPDKFSLTQPMNIFLLLFGNVNYMPDVFCLIGIFILLRILRKKGFADQCLFHYEDPGSCTARIVVNYYKEDIFDNEAKYLMYKNELQNGYLLQKLKKKERKGILDSFKNYRLDLIKQRIQLSILHDVFKKEFMNNIVTYLKRTRNDMLKANKDNIDNFMWRNFSYYARKPGLNISSLGTLAMFISITLTLIFLPMIGKDGATLLKMVKENVVIGKVTFIVVIYSIVVIWDGVINRKFYHDKTGILRRPFLFKQLSRMNIRLQTQTLFAHPVVKVRKAMRKLVGILRWKKMITENENTIKDNPLKRKFYLSIIFWFVFHLVIMVVMIQHANDDTKLSTLKGLVCFFNPRTNQCRDESEMLKIRLMYIFPVLYVALASLQIHFGKKMLWSRVTKFTLFEKIGHMIKSKIPFGREFGIGMDFLANKSALQFRHRLIYDDISLTLRTSKFNQISRVKNGFGKKKMKVQQIIVGIGWVFLFILMIFGPLIPFALGNNDKRPFGIESGKIGVYVQDKNKMRIGDLFLSKINFKVQNTTRKDDVYYKLNHLEKIYFDYEQIKLLNLSTRSEEFQDVQDKFFVYRHKRDVKGILRELKNGGIEFELEVLMSNKKFYKYKTTLEFTSFNEESLKELAMMIVSDCKVINYKRTIYLNRLPLVLQMQDNRKNFTLIPPKVRNSSLLQSSKLSISSDCSNFQNTVFNIETDDFESGHVTFTILTQFDTNSIKNIIKDIIGLDVGVVLLYLLLFKYLGVNLIRKMFFNNQAMVWFTQIPEPEKIICILDAVRYAQYEGDFLREELLFFRLIDILRNPENVRTMTGNIRERMWQQFLRDKKEAGSMKKKLILRDR